MKVSELTLGEAIEQKRWKMVVSSATVERERELTEKSLAALDGKFMSQAEKHRCEKLKVQDTIQFKHTELNGDRIKISVTRTK